MVLRLYSRPALVDCGAGVTFPLEKKPIPAKNLSPRALAHLLHLNAHLMKSELVDQAALIITDPPILINLVSKRVRQLQAGRPALVDRRPGYRDADIALTEIIQGKIRPKMPDEPEADL